MNSMCSKNDIIKRITAEAPAHLKPSGFLLMEIGDDQADAVMDLVLSSGAYRSASIIKDLAQKDRMLMAQIECMCFKFVCKDTTKIAYMQVFIIIARFFFFLFAYIKKK